MYVKGHGGHVQLFPEATSMFVFAAVQIHVTLQSADTCMTKVHIW